MTDKEKIIIDGVDVKNCRRRIGKNNYCRYFKRLCSENNFNCVWKQLARKTQECEQKDERIIELTKEALSLKQECKELKKQLETSEEWRIKAEKLELNNGRYRKALEEIEKIVKDWYKNEWSCYKCRINMDKKLKNILGIINKAKDGN